MPPMRVEPAARVVRGFKSRLARAAYTGVWCLLLPLALLRLFWRARREPAYRSHIGERLGLYRAAQPSVAGRPLLWLHAVSLGETRAAQPLLEALRSLRPDLRLLLTHMTATGRSAGAQLLRDGDQQVWLPYDLPGPLRRFLHGFRPDFGVLMETEVWPNLTAACAAAGIPLLLANARLSARSAARWERWPTLGAAAFGALVAAAQTEADAQRLRRVGVREAWVAGNLKFDRSSDAALHALGLQWRAAAQRPVLLLASTRAQGGNAEEDLLLDALPRRLLDRALLVLVPRHPQRIPEVLALLQRRGLRTTRRSEGWPDAQTEVWLGDSMGEMPAYYAMADAAFVGGSLLELGGQNLIEACAEGCPVVMGPHCFNFAQAVEQGVAAGAVRRAADAAAVWEVLDRWLEDAAARSQARSAARDFAASHCGAAMRHAQWIAARLPPRP
jgi:3-deoxy-D-manno-octulosonic-acid transferase